MIHNVVALAVHEVGKLQAVAFDQSNAPLFDIPPRHHSPCFFFPVVFGRKSWNHHKTKPKTSTCPPSPYPRRTLIHKTLSSNHKKGMDQRCDHMFGCGESIVALADLGAASCMAPGTRGGILFCGLQAAEQRDRDLHLLLVFSGLPTWPSSTTPPSTRGADAPVLYSPIPLHGCSVDFLILCSGIQQLTSSLLRCIVHWGLRLGRSIHANSCLPFSPPLGPQSPRFAVD